MKLNKIIGSTGALAVCALALTAMDASAVPVTWNVDAIGPISLTPSADTIGVAANSGFVDLAYNTPTTIVGFSLFTYTIGNSGALNQQINFDLSRGLTLNGVTHTIIQTGNVNVTPSLDTFSVVLGSVNSTFDLGNGDYVTVSVAGDTFSAPSTGTTSQARNATFTVTHVPDGGMTVAMLGLALGGLGLLRRKF